ncbi:MAG: hypothetical protein N2444_09885 [Methylocystis sp.]|nr:hypothetical protein [Methylocystis sp.]
MGKDAQKKLRKSVETERLHRYTNIQSLLHLSQEKRLARLDPSSWDDKNDVFFMEAFHRRAGYGRLFALCFTQSLETYHHWRVFAPGPDGARISFYRKKLLSQIKRAGADQCRFKMRAVRCRLLRDVGRRPIRIKDLPFTKRSAFFDEREFCILCSSDAERDARASAKLSPLTLDCVERVTLSPWLPSGLFEPIKKTLKSIDGCAALKIYRTTLRENDAWKRASLDGGSK